MTPNDTFIRFKPYFWLKLILFILIFYTRVVIVTKITHQKTRENHIEVLTKFVVDVSEYLLVHLDLQLITLSALKSTQKFVNALIGWSRVRSKNSSTSFFFPRAFMTYRSPVYLFQTIMMVRFRGLNPKKKFNWRWIELIANDPGGRRGPNWTDLTWRDLVEIIPDWNEKNVVAAKALNSFSVKKKEPMQKGWMRHRMPVQVLVISLFTGVGYSIALFVDSKRNEKSLYSKKNSEQSFSWLMYFWYLLKLFFNSLFFFFSYGNTTTSSTV